VARADGVDDGSKVIVDLGVNTGTAVRAVGKEPTASERSGGAWIVVVVYVAAVAALAFAIYERFLV
jgi:hypothetical protein